MPKNTVSRRQFLTGFGLRAGQLYVGAAVLGGVGNALAATGEAPAPAAPRDARAEAALPFLLVEKEGLNPDLQDLRAVAFDARGRLYAGGRAGVRVFDAANREVRFLRTAAPVQAVAVSPSGDLFVALPTRILRFDLEGKALKDWGEDGRGPGQMRNVTSIAVSETLVHVADSANRKVLRFDQNGEFADEREGYQIPSPFFDCAIGPKGVLAVANTGNHRIEFYGDDGGTLARQWGQLGTGLSDFCGCCNPSNLAFLPDGRILTAEKGVLRIKLYDGEGKLLAHLGGAAFADGQAGMALAADAKGRIALADRTKNIVRFFEVKERQKV
jgi:hypothetical protein